MTLQHYDQCSHMLAKSFEKKPQKTKLDFMNFQLYGKF